MKSCLINVLVLIVINLIILHVMPTTWGLLILLIFIVFFRIFVY